MWTITLGMFLSFTACFVAMITSLIITLYVLACKKPTFNNHIFILIGLISFLILFSKFIQLAILDPSSYLFYDYFEHLCFILLWILMILLIPKLIYDYIKQHHLWFYFTKHQKLLDRLDDIILIYTLEGKLSGDNLDKTYTSVSPLEESSQNLCPITSLDLRDHYQNMYSLFYFLGEGCDTLEKSRLLTYLEANHQIRHDYFNLYGQHYQITQVPIMKNRQCLLGKAIILHNCQHDYCLEQEIKKKNEKLDLANTRLQAYLKKEAQLEGEVLKLKVYNQVQGELILSIELVLKTIDTYLNDPIPHLSKEEISSLVSDLRSILRKVRETVNRILPTMSDHTQERATI